MNAKGLIDILSKFDPKDEVRVFQNTRVSEVNGAASVGDGVVYVGVSLLPGMEVSGLIAEDMEAGQSDCGWISVEDRLPDKGEWVLVFGYGYGFVGGGSTHIGVIRNDDQWFIEGGYEKAEVECWMPLPEPPK